MSSPRGVVMEYIIGIIVAAISAVFCGFQLGKRHEKSKTTKWAADQAKLQELHKTNNFLPGQIVTLDAWKKESISKAETKTQMTTEEIKNASKDKIKSDFNDAFSNGPVSDTTVPGPK